MDTTKFLKLLSTQLQNNIDNIDQSNGNRISSEVLDFLISNKLLRDFNIENDPVLKMVHEFQTVFESTLENHPKIDNSKVNMMRIHLLQEELGELSLAIANGDILGVFDALCDLDYVLQGTWLSLGFHAAKLDGIKEVHRSNMSKLDQNSKPIKTPGGRIVKSSKYTPPNLKNILHIVYEF